jgi:hypothetical protein
MKTTAYVLSEIDLTRRAKQAHDGIMAAFRMDRSLPA